VGWAFCPPRAYITIFTLFTCTYLLPFATLARSDSPTQLLEQVAARVARIKETQQRQNLAACVDVLAGLRFEPNLIRRLFPKEIMRESLTYQEILQEGRQEGRQEGEVALLIRQLTRRFGELDLAVQEQIRSLSIPELEELGEAMLDFQELTNLTAWLEQHSG
jgi:predicted transposase YdaD